MYICIASAALIQRPAGCPDSLFPLNLATFDQLCLQFNFEKLDWEVARNRKSAKLSATGSNVTKYGEDGILDWSLRQRLGITVGVADR